MFLSIMEGLGRFIEGNFCVPSLIISWKVIKGVRSKSFTSMGFVYFFLGIH